MRLIALFDNEEVGTVLVTLLQPKLFASNATQTGSQTAHGAASNMMPQILERIVTSFAEVPTPEITQVAFRYLFIYLFSFLSDFFSFI